MTGKESGIDGLSGASRGVSLKVMGKGKATTLRAMLRRLIHGRGGQGEAEAARPAMLRRGRGRANGSANGGAQAIYDHIVELMKKRHRIRVRKWRTTTTGCAWQVFYDDGRVVRLIEAPYPRGPMSAAVFLHEIGHHAIGFNRYKPRCLEEYMAWQWALRAMRQHNITVTDRVQRRVEQSLRYAVAKAQRRGLRSLPVELVKYVA